MDKYFCIYKVQYYYNFSKKFFKYLNDKELVFITKILNKLIDSDYISIEDKSNIIMVKTLILKKVETQEDWVAFLISMINMKHNLQLFKYIFIFLNDISAIL